jgi:hypothetical protein
MSIIIKKEYLNFLKNNKYKREHKNKTIELLNDINNYINWYINNNIKQYQNNKVIIINYENIDIQYLTYFSRFCNKNKIILYIYSENENIPDIDFFNQNYYIGPYTILHQKFKIKLTKTKIINYLNNVYNLYVLHLN